MVIDAHFHLTFFQESARMKRWPSIGEISLPTTRQAARRQTGYGR